MPRKPFSAELATPIDVGPELDPRNWDPASGAACGTLAIPERITLPSVGRGGGR
jgi:hypothetical protein